MPPERTGSGHYVGGARYTFNPLTPTVAICVHFVPDRVKSSFVICDMCAGCQKLQMTAQPGLTQDALYSSCTRMATVGVKRLSGIVTLVIPAAVLCRLSMTSTLTSLTCRGSSLVTSRLELDDDIDRQRTRPTVSDTRPINVYTSHTVFSAHVNRFI